MPDRNSEFRPALEQAFEQALVHLEKLDTAPVGATVDLGTLRRRLAKPLRDDSLPPEQVVRELVDDVQGGIIGTAGGRFFGWVIGGALPASLGADWLASAWDQNAGLYACAPAAAVVEEVAGAWLKELLGLPAQASFALVTGCQMAHVTCLAAARHAVLVSRGWDVESRGLYGAPPIRLVCNALIHGTVERAVRFLGLGTQNFVEVPADRLNGVQPEALQQALESNPDAPTIVLLQAGEINTGAFDPFEKLIPLARQYGAWVHIDGAFGLWAAASPTYCHLLKGAHAADSWATDGHKWLNTPYDCGYAFVAHPEAHRASMSHRASYLTHDADARDQMDWNPEWSRRARGFATYAAVRQLGRRGIRELVDRCCRHARSLVSGIGNLPGAEVISEPVINQGLVRFPDMRPGASAEDHDRRTDEIVAAVMASGEAFFTGSTWQGRRVMRVSVCNWRTSSGDIDRSIQAVAEALKAGARHRSVSK